MLSKKSIITLMTASVLAVTLTGCGNNTDSTLESELVATEATAMTEVTVTEETTEPATEPETEPETEPATDPETEPETEPETTEPVDERAEELAFFDDLIQKTISAYQNKQPEEYLKYTTDEINLYMQKDLPWVVNQGLDYTSHETVLEEITASINENRFAQLPDYSFLSTDFKSEYVVTKKDHIYLDELPYLVEVYSTDTLSESFYIASGQLFEDYNFEDVVIVYGTYTGSDGSPCTSHVYIAKIDGEWLVDPIFYPSLEKEPSIGLTEEMLGADKYEIGEDGHYIVN